MTPRSPGPTRFAAIRGDDGGEAPYPWADRWSTQRTTGPGRLVVAPARGRHVDTLLELAGCLREPFGILWVLLVSRCDGHRPARYQSPVPTSRAETEAFVTRFRAFFEGDGRHHLWLTSLPDRETIVYDNHDLIYAYGPLDAYRATLGRAGFTEGPIRIPAPHQHRYNVDFDAAEREVMHHWAWRLSDLQPYDDP